MVYGSKLYYIPVKHRQRTLLASNIQCSFNISCFIRIDTIIVLLKIIQIIFTNVEVKDGDLEKFLAGKEMLKKISFTKIFLQQLHFLINLAGSHQKSKSYEVDESGNNK